MADTPPSRAHGRSLADFGPRSAGEATLLAACRNGGVADLGSERPEAEDADNRVRADFVRFLALGGDKRAAMHEHGIQLQGAWLVGVLDLANCQVDTPLALVDCRIERIDAIQARLLRLDLGGSSVGDPAAAQDEAAARPVALNGEHVAIKGDLLLRSGFHAVGEVRLRGASVGGVLECSGGRFENPGGDALASDRATIHGGLFLCDRFHASGEVRFLGAAIGGNLQCDGGRFENADGDALSCDGAQINGDVFLRELCNFSGTVRFLGASIGGDLDCSGACCERPSGSALSCDNARITGNLIFRAPFHATGEVRLTTAVIGGSFECRGAEFKNPGGDALSCEGVRVAGGFFFRRSSIIEGRVLLSAMQVGQLADAMGSWEAAKGNLVLDGFGYTRFASGAATAAAQRIAWLDGQILEHLKEEFRPQPWEQVIAVLRAMGHPNEARRVAIAKENRLRRAGRLGKAWRDPRWYLHIAYGWLVQYGYTTQRLVIILLVLWLVPAALYWAAANPTAAHLGRYLIAPVGAKPTPECLLARAAAKSGNPCPPAVVDYRTFVPLVYSLETLLPVVKFGYASEWRPVIQDERGKPLRFGQAVQWLTWLQIAFGWIAGLLLVVAIGRLIKRD